MYSSDFKIVVLFRQDRVPVAKHLPLAWTKSSAEEEKKLMESLDTLTEQFK